MNSEENKFIADLYQEMYAVLYNYGKRILGNPVVVEDIVQDTFLIACVKGSEFFGHPNPQGWLVNSFKNNIRNYLRCKAAVTELLAKTPAGKLAEDYPCDGGLESDPDLLYGNFAASKEYELLKKYALENRSLAELAQEYGVSINCCKQRLLRARRKLQEIMDSDIKDNNNINNK